MLDMLFCRSFRHWVSRMHRWASQRISLEGIRQIFSWPWPFIVKLLLGIGFPLLAIRYLWKDRIASKDEEKSISGKSSSGRDETHSETLSTPESEPEQNSPCALEWRVCPDDDYFCAYDSTWDSDETQEHNKDLRLRGKCFNRSHSYKFEQFQSAARDLHNYRHDYPDGTPNLDFYLGKRASSPDNLYISDFHKWKGNYDTLESVHSYIQWLFPLQEPGVNYEACTLTKQEIQEFCQNEAAKTHLLESYKLMLDFYGIELCDETTGEVKRTLNWKDRFHNLNRRTHNNLRITRILKCLGTLGFAHFQAPLVHFFLKETLVNRELPNVKSSVLDYFLFAVLDKKQRRSLLKFAFLNSDESEEFVWCPKKIQQKWSSLRATKESEDYKEKDITFVLN